MSTADLNGHDVETRPVSVADALDEHVRGLEALLVPLRAERDQLKARVAELGEQEKRIAHAIGSLRPGRRDPAPAPASAPKGWTPSEERLKSLFALFVAEPKPISPTQLAEKTEGLGVETASKGAKILRERQLLRVAGALRGGGKLYAPMPGAEWRTSPRLDEAASS